MRQNINSNQLAATRFLDYYDFVVSQAVRCASFSGLAQDIIQEVYIDFTKKFDSFELSDDLRPLLAGMIRIASLRLREKYFKSLPQSMIHLAEKLQKLRAEKDLFSEDSNGFQEKLAALDDCLKKLSGKSHEMVVRYYFRGEKTSMIAEKLKISENTLRQRFSRIRHKLRQCVQVKIKKNEFPTE